LGLALDEPKDSDKTYDNDNLKFLVDSGLMENCGEIKVDYNDDGYRSGFAITSKVPIAGAGGSCGSSCGSGSCS
jgi:Fe-S cluster assembly iron-binding protein IscA